MGKRLLCLNVGCGNLYEESTDEREWINIDHAKGVKTDLCQSFAAPLPFKENSVDHIKAIACLGQIESNKNFLFAINQFQQLLKPEASIFIYLPHKDHPHCYIDPFNVRRFNEDSWLAFDQEHIQYKAHLSYYGFLPWKDVTVSTNKQGFLVVWMIKP